MSYMPTTTRLASTRTPFLRNLSIKKRTYVFSMSGPCGKRRSDLHRFDMSIRAINQECLEISGSPDECLSHLCKAQRDLPLVNLFVVFKFLQTNVCSWHQIGKCVDVSDCGIYRLLNIDTFAALLRQKFEPRVQNQFLNRKRIEAPIVVTRSGPRSETPPEARY